ncbi:hypothetical protein DIPPA_05075 [Diplonema papillatum]|nr:hypothetical protein DIPPA_05075 [Diplonema papillatum]
MPATQGSTLREQQLQLAARNFPAAAGKDGGGYGRAFLCLVNRLRQPGDRPTRRRSDSTGAGAHRGGSTDALALSVVGSGCSDSSLTPVADVAPPPPNPTKLPSLDGPKPRRTPSLPSPEPSQAAKPAAAATPTAAGGAKKSSARPAPTATAATTTPRDAGKKRPRQLLADAGPSETDPPTVYVRYHADHPASQAPSKLQGGGGGGGGVWQRGDGTAEEDAGTGAAGQRKSSRSGAQAGEGADPGERARSATAKRRATSDKSGDKTCRKASDAACDKACRKASEKAGDKTCRKASDAACDKACRKESETAGDKTCRKASDAACDKACRKESETAGDKTCRKASDAACDKACRKASEKAGDKASKSPAYPSPARAGKGPHLAPPPKSKFMTAVGFGSGNTSVARTLATKQKMHGLLRVSPRNQAKHACVAAGAAALMRAVVDTAPLVVELKYLVKTAAGSAESSISGGMALALGVDRQRVLVKAISMLDAALSADAARALDTALSIAEGTNAAADLQNLLENFVSGVSFHATRAKLLDFYKNLRRLWLDKPGDILTELYANLRTPEDESPIKKYRLFDYITARMEAKAAAAPPSADQAAPPAPLQLLVLFLYTLDGPDIDRLMLFSDAPPLGYYKTDPTVWKTYTDAYTDSGVRNPDIYYEIGIALRAFAENPDLSGRAAGKVGKWIKMIGLLMGVRLKRDRAGPGLYYRGMCGDAVHETAAGLQVGEWAGWAAPNSCTPLRSACDNFLKTDASVLWEVRNSGEFIDIAKWSKYPAEEEALFPPLTMLKVTAVDKNVPLRDGITGIRVRCTSAGLFGAHDPWLGSPGDYCGPWTRLCLEDEEAALVRLRHVMDCAKAGYSTVTVQVFPENSTSGQLPGQQPSDAPVDFVRLSGPTPENSVGLAEGDGPPRRASVAFDDSVFDGGAAGGAQKAWPAWVVGEVHSSLDVSSDALSVLRSRLEGQGGSHAVILGAHGIDDATPSFEWYVAVGGPLKGIDLGVARSAPLHPEAGGFDPPACARLRKKIAQALASAKGGQPAGVFGFAAGDQLPGKMSGNADVFHLVYRRAEQATPSDSGPPCATLSVTVNDDVQSSFTVPLDGGGPGGAAFYPFCGLKRVESSARLLTAAQAADLALRRVVVAEARARETAASAEGAGRAAAWFTAAGMREEAARVVVCKREVADLLEIKLAATRDRQQRTARDLLNVSSWEWAGREEVHRGALAAHEHATRCEMTAVWCRQVQAVAEALSYHWPLSAPEDQSQACVGGYHLGEVLCGGWAVSFALWARYDSLAQTHFLLELNDAADNKITVRTCIDGYCSKTTTGCSVDIKQQRGKCPPFQSFNFFEENQWQHVAAVFHKKTVSLYRNGELREMYERPTDVCPARLARKACVAGGTAAGLKDVRIYNRPLPKGDVKYLFDHTAPTSPPRPKLCLPSTSRLSASISQRAEENAASG